MSIEAAAPDRGWLLFRVYHPNRDRSGGGWTDASRRELDKNSQDSIPILIDRLSTRVFSAVDTSITRRRLYPDRAGGHVAFIIKLKPDAESLPDAVLRLAIPIALCSSRPQRTRQRPRRGPPCTGSVKWRNVTPATPFE